MKLHNKNGTLTTYGFACGYIEEKTLLNGFRVQLYRDGCWHVRKFDKENARLVWECPLLLTDARKLFRTLCRSISVN